jgi:hypothetical protein
MYLKTRVVFYVHVTAHCNRFLFNNQRDALIIQIYSVIKLCLLLASFWTSSGVIY